MKWRVRPSRLAGSIAIPPSKSHTIRALLVATLAGGTSIIRKPLLSGDGASAVKAAQSLGAEIEFRGTDLTIKGIGSDFDKGQDFFDMGNSGTGTNLFASAAALGTRIRKFDGDNSLRSRPFRPVLEALKGLGAQYNVENSNRDLPFTIQGPLKGGTTRVDGFSSQFVSSLLLTCPLIKTDKTVINVYNLHEHPYVELTLWWMKKQNISIEYNPDLLKFVIPGNQKYSAFDMNVPGDFSSATFPAIGAALCGSMVDLADIDFTDPQGDKGIFEELKKAGVSLDTSERGASIKGCKEIRGIEIDLNAMPDALPAFSVFGCCAEGETRIVNVAQARIKETDRIRVMHDELRKMGASVTERDDGLVINKSKLHGAVVHGHDDHRVVMALALAGMVADGETVIETAEAADVTYPTFVSDFRALGADIEVLD